MMRNNRYYRNENLLTKKQKNLIQNILNETKIPVVVVGEGVVVAIVVVVGCVVVTTGVVVSTVVVVATVEVISVVSNLMSLISRHIRKK